MPVSLASAQANERKQQNRKSYYRTLATCKAGFKKVVADRWEFANEYFRKGAKHLLSEIHRRKTSQHHHQHYSEQPPQFFQPEDGFSWIDPPFQSPKPTTDILTALSEDNQRLRRKNCMLLSELSHMKNLYNDIIHFIQNHVKPMPYEQRAYNAAPKLIELGSSSAEELGVPAVVSFTMSACGVMAFKQVRALMEKGLIPLKGYEKTSMMQKFCQFKICFDMALIWTWNENSMRLFCWLGSHRVTQKTLWDFASYFIDIWTIE
nr:heat stress transcription factor B-4d-like [Populus alba]